jgi:uncharacterized RDD family membrane protein YckC
MTMTNPPPYPGQPYPGPPYPGQPPYSAGQPYPSQPYPGQRYPSQPYPFQAAYPNQPYPGQPYGYPYPGVPPRDPTGVVGARVGQYIVDVLLVAVPAIVLLVGLVSMTANADGDSAVLPLVGTLVLMLLWAAGGWLVSVWWPSTHGGQTPAMGWLNLRIVTDHGGSPSLGALTVRWLLLAVDAQAFGLVGLIVMLTTARHQRVGDMAANTLVVRAN